MGELVQKVELMGSDLPWLEGLREKGAVFFERQGLPTAKTEAWKYTRPRDLLADDFILPPLEEEKENACTCGEHCTCGHHQREGEDFPLSAYVIDFENGALEHIAHNLPRGVSIKPLIEAIYEDDGIRKYLNKSFDMEKNPFAALNTAYLEQGLFITIEKNMRLDKPLALVHHSFSCHENLMFHLRNVIVLEEGAKAEIVEYYNYSGNEKSRYFTNIVNEIYVGRHAELKHYKFQDEAFKAVHIAYNAVKVKGEGRYNGFCLQRGGNLARNETRLSLTEERAEAEINAAYIMNGWAVIDTTTDVEHLAPYTKSTQLVKGVVGGQAKGVFQGKIHIAPMAIKTEGAQLHKALLLTDEAEIDVKPELEIYNDDVKCSHGAASGELDADQLFYMRSRGIGEEEAKQILVDAYLQDVLEKINNQDIKDWLAAKAKLAK